jgi:Ni/Co efflux regulator RcnB
MKNIYRNAVSAGLALALATAPLASAQQQNWPNNHDQNGSGGQHYSGQQGGSSGGQGQHTQSYTGGQGNHTPSYSGGQQGGSPGGQGQHDQNYSGGQGQHYPGQQGMGMMGHPEGQYQGHNGYGNGYGYNDHHDWQRGGYYGGHREVINNWGYYRLQPPPYGYEWVQDGDQFVLIAIASGIISSIILNSMMNNQ